MECSFSGFSHWNLWIPLFTPAGRQTLGQWKRYKTYEKVMTTLKLIHAEHEPHWLVKQSKVKCTLAQALRLCTGRTARRGSRGMALLFLDHDTRRSEGSASRTSPSLPPGKTPYPFYRKLGGPQGRSGQVRKISPPPVFEPRTVQPVASRYTDYATRPTTLIWISGIIEWKTTAFSLWCLVLKILWRG